MSSEVGGRFVIGDFLFILWLGHEKGVTAFYGYADKQKLSYHEDRVVLFSFSE